jgi:hypothetical protein
MVRDSSGDVRRPGKRGFLRRQAESQGNPFGGRERDAPTAFVDLSHRPGGRQARPVSRIRQVDLPGLAAVDETDRPHDPEPG